MSPSRFFFLFSKATAATTDDNNNNNNNDNKKDNGESNADDRNNQRRVHSDSDSNAHHPTAEIRDDRLRTTTTNDTKVQPNFRNQRERSKKVKTWPNESSACPMTSRWRCSCSSMTWCAGAIRSADRSKARLFQRITSGTPNSKQTPIYRQGSRLDSRP